MLYEKHLVNFCLENNINLSDVYDKFLEEQIKKNENPEIHSMLLEMYAENWFGNLMGGAGKLIGKGVQGFKQGIQNFKTQYNQQQPDAALKMAMQAKELLTKAGLYDYFKDSFAKLKQEMMARSQGATPTQNVGANTAPSGTTGSQNASANNAVPAGPYTGMGSQTT
jgi:Sec-independent protein translocase protein TatA